jgi:hypothetical protein
MACHAPRRPSPDESGILSLEVGTTGDTLNGARFSRVELAPDRFELVQKPQAQRPSVQPDEEDETIPTDYERIRAELEKEFSSEVRSSRSTTQAATKTCRD